MANTSDILQAYFIYHRPSIIYPSCCLAKVIKGLEEFSAKAVHFLFIFLEKEDSLDFPWLRLYSYPIRLDALIIIIVVTILLILQTRAHTHTHTYTHTHTHKHTHTHNGAYQTKEKSHHERKIVDTSFSEGNASPKN